MLSSSCLVDKHTTPSSQSNLASVATSSLHANDAPSGIPEFVKKLFYMLQDNSFPHILSWGVGGESFVVKEPNEFARLILPKHFKHSNFASFVRQLNKYDFHKIRNPEDGPRPYGDQVWEFRHPNFQYDRKELLEGIKRKTSAKPVRSNSSTASASQLHASSHSSIQAKHRASGTSAQDQLKALTAQLQTQIEQMQQTQTNMDHHLQALAKKYTTTFQDIVNFNKKRIGQDHLVQKMMQFMMHQEAAAQGMHSRGRDIHDNATYSSESISRLDEMQRMFASYNSVAQASEGQMNQITQHVENLQHTFASASPMMSDPVPPPSTTTNTTTTYTTTQPNTTTTTAIATSSPPSSAAVLRSHVVDPLSATVTDPIVVSSTTMTSAPVSTTVTTTPQDVFPMETAAMISNPAVVGHDGMAVLTISPSAPATSDTMTAITPAPTALTTSRGIKRKSLIPGWTIPPKVLLVDDDSIFRRLSTRLLQLAGCTIDVAVDGLEALTKLSSDRYDIVLMDIMMPNLDGISATKNIRLYDTWTPIISMTANTTDRDIQQYITSGMTDVLPKPLDQRMLCKLLERYCAHLKLVGHRQGQEGEIRRSLELGLSTPMIKVIEEGTQDKGKQVATQQGVDLTTTTTFINMQDITQLNDFMGFVSQRYQPSPAPPLSVPSNLQQLPYSYSLPASSEATSVPASMAVASTLATPPSAPSQGHWQIYVNNQSLQHVRGDEAFYDDGSMHDGHRKKHKPNSCFT
ncbi:uncharacterized protein BYT42DRAFT_573116 [Radiomyces spectabilis]|uniref:uncharacterized protein n=1 Tax=Radiomyces spectabilis TaxID=64574 RepID=UPI002220A220|nr:uncharacterized protein BYT42DRAFT_573116 [Radiomyces spectabilis]KAI8376018.1 hypothetical protein BYT42DRAFT_573116 [Radiomyces spectabilis]